MSVAKGQGHAPVAIALLESFKFLEPESRSIRSDHFSLAEARPRGSAAKVGVFTGVRAVVGKNVLLGE